jgi:phosphatidylserine decarboxylase
LKNHQPLKEETSMNDQASAVRRYRAGRWLPHQDALEAWLDGIHEKVRANAPETTLHPVVEEFRTLIDHDPIVRMYISQMIAQVPHTKKYRKKHLESIDQLLFLINEIIGRAPEYNETALVGCPLNAVLDWCMGTPAGFAVFRLKAINSILKKILTVWCEFLSSPDSLYILNDSPKGWKCAAAQKSTKMQEFVYDSHDKYWGFPSWNDFFIRRFKPGARPVAEPDNNKVVVSSCESTPYAISLNVKRQDRFWIKSQPYSLQDMLANDESVDQFVGGTIYQAFLDAYNYHRWHSPVKGTIRKAFVQEGTYYSEADSEGEDPAGPNNSQGYITHIATRAIIFIECDDPVIGLMCLMPVGMAEVSSCVIHPQVQPGYPVEKGQELGYFQYGGSTHCLIFRPGAISEFSLGAIPQPHNANAPLVLLGSKIATAN